MPIKLVEVALLGARWLVQCLEGIAARNPAEVTDPPPPAEVCACLDRALQSVVEELEAVPPEEAPPLFNLWDGFYTDAPARLVRSGARS